MAKNGMRAAAICGRAHLSVDALPLGLGLDVDEVVKANPMQLRHIVLRMLHCIAGLHRPLHVRQTHPTVFYVSIREARSEAGWEGYVVCYLQVCWPTDEC